MEASQKAKSISDPELEKEYILHELEHERAVWLGSMVVEETERAYENIDKLLGELSDVGKVLGRQNNGTPE